MSSPVIVERVRPPGSQLAPWQRVRAVRKGDAGELGVLDRHQVLRASIVAGVSPSRRAGTSIASPGIGRPSWNCQVGNLSALPSE